MKILLVSATNIEAEAARKHLSPTNHNESDLIENHSFDQIEADLLISGVGVPFTMYHLTKSLINKQYDLALMIGIAGSYNNDHQIGDVVNVHEESFADIGIRHSGHFETLFESKLADKNTFPFRDGKLINPTPSIKAINQLQSVSGLTVNTIDSGLQEINRKKARYGAAIETMEGAAFFYSCAKEKIPFYQIRGISNYVEERDKKNWNIPLALNNISDHLYVILEELKNQNS